MKPVWSNDVAPGVVVRVVVEGDLILESPAHFGGGDSGDPLDLPLLVDPLDGCSPLLTGASLAGALRAHLRSCDDDGKNVDLLFGTAKRHGDGQDDEDGFASRLIIDDSLGEAPGQDTRWSVRINPRWRTAEAKKLFDMPFWQAGTRFPLRFELQVLQDDEANEEQLRRLLATALHGLGAGEVALGARKTRGFGRARVAEWRVKTYNLATVEGLLDWIDHGDQPLVDVPSTGDVATALQVNSLLPRRRALLSIESTFALRSSLLVRSGGYEGEQGPDMVHLCSPRRDGSARTTPVLPGTSLAGALRARALKIARTLERPSGLEDRDGGHSRQLIDGLFGPEIRHDVAPRVSRVVVREAFIDGGRMDLVQTRVSIDRFTGGAREAQLFSEQPLFAGNGAELKVTLQVDQPQHHEVGLLLLLLKDLWTGDLPLGGESAVGRGRLDGRRADIRWEGSGGTPHQWVIEAVGPELKIDGDIREMEDCVQALVRHLGGEPDGLLQTTG